MTRTIALVGTAPSYEQVFDCIGQPDFEVWTINRMVLNGALKPHDVDRLIEIHIPELATSEPSGLGLDHEAWLRQEHPFPLYMEEVYPEYPSSVKYPLEAVKEACFSGLTRAGKPTRLLTSSFSYLFGLAILERVPKVQIFGFEMKKIEAYSQQREGALLLIGVAQGLGMEVDCVDEFGLYDAPIYGYEVVDMISRVTFEKDQHVFLTDFEKAKAELMHVEGQFYAKNQEIEKARNNGQVSPELVAELQALIQQRSEIEVRAQRLDALVQLVEKYLAICYSQEVPDEIVQRLVTLS